MGYFNLSVYFGAWIHESAEHSYWTGQDHLISTELFCMSKIMWGNQWVRRIRMVSHVLRLTNYWLGLLFLLHHGVSLRFIERGGGELRSPQGRWSLTQKNEVVSFSVIFMVESRPKDSPSSRDSTIYWWEEQKIWPQKAEWRTSSYLIIPSH